MAYTQYYVTAAGAGSHNGTSEANAWTWAEMVTAINALGAGGAAGRYINVKKGAHTGGTSAISLIGGTIGSPMVLAGYNTTPGDLDTAGRTNTGIFTLVITNYPVVTYTGGGRLTVAAHTVMRNISFVGATSPLVTMSNDTHAIRCKFSCSAATAGACSVTINRSSLIDCDGDGFNMSDGGSSAVLVAASATGAYIEGGKYGGARGIILGAASGLHVSRAVIFQCSTYGIQIPTGGFCTVDGCTIAYCGNSGINATNAGTVTQLRVTNTLLTDNTQYGILVTSAAIGALLVQHCRFDRNGTAAMSGFDDFRTATSLYNNTTSATAANEYEDQANYDYRIKSTSPAVQAGQFGVDIGAFKYHATAGAAARVVMSSL